MGICPPSLKAEGGPVFVEFTNICQVVITTSLTVACTITVGESAIQLTIIVCNFSNVPVGYDLRLKPGGAGNANEHLLRGADTAGVREIQAGSTEFMEFGLRPREEWEVLVIADAADSVATTIGTSQLFDSGHPEVCPP